jgi:4-carboxymuconolactone decarboxylase
MSRAVGDRDAGDKEIVNDLEVGLYDCQTGIEQGAPDPMSENTTFEAGMKVRREVLGSEHVDRSLAKATEFSRPLQELVTEYCWGSVWERPGLERSTRSLLNIAMLTALGRQHELAVHVRGALNNGVTTSEIQEVILQAAVYCGMPSALDAQRTAEAALQELGVELPAAVGTGLEATNG